MNKFNWVKKLVQNLTIHNSVLKLRLQSTFFFGAIFPFEEEQQLIGGTITRDAPIGHVPEAIYETRRDNTVATKVLHLERHNIHCGVKIVSKFQNCLIFHKLRVLNALSSGAMLRCGAHNHSILSSML